MRVKPPAYNNISEQVWNTAVYIRLSKEDIDKKDESNSVKNQRNLIDEYLKSKSNFKVYNYYIDDGYTGIDFYRPGFERMIEDIKTGEVNCIVVKDMSRFGRDYIGTGQYLEKVLPLYNVRFISINDNIDTAYGINADIAPFKAVINDMYCADISKKVRSAKEAMAKSGKFYGGFAPYGYVKDPQDKHRLVIDNNSAWVVRRIFHLALEGLGANSIAKRLNDDGIPSPAYYKKYLLGLNYGYNTKREKTLWTPTQIRRILANETYLGNLVQHKSTKISYKMKKKIERRRNDYITVKNTHEPIIGIDLWRDVQEAKKTRTRKLKDQDKTHNFSGIIRCGECGRSMRRKYSYSGTKRAEKIYYFVCGATCYAGDKVCQNRRGIREDAFYKVILEDIKKEIEIALTADELMQAVDKFIETEGKKHHSNSYLRALEERQNNVSKLLKEIYFDYKSGIVSKKQYLQYRAEYEKEEKEIGSKLKNASRYSGKNHINSTNTMWLNEVKKHANIISLNRHILIGLINCIYVYKDKRIRIEYKFKDTCSKALNKLLS